MGRAGERGRGDHPAQRACCPHQGPNRAAPVPCRAASAVDLKVEVRVACLQRLEWDGRKVTDERACGCDKKGRGHGRGWERRESESECERE